MAVRCVRRLEPGLLIGPHHIAQWQNGSAEADCRPIYCRHYWLPELDEGVNEGPEVEKKHVNTRLTRETPTTSESGRYLMVSAILMLSFFLSSVNRRMKYKKSRPQQNTLPTAPSKTILLSSDAAVAMALWISLITWRRGRCYHDNNSNVLTAHASRYMLRRLGGEWPHLRVQRVVLGAFGGKQDVGEAILLLHHNISVAVSTLRLSHTESKTFVKSTAFLQTPFTGHGGCHSTSPLHSRHPVGSYRFHEWRVTWRSQSIASGPASLATLEGEKTVSANRAHLSHSLSAWQRV